MVSFHISCTVLAGVITLIFHVDYASVNLTPKWWESGGFYKTLNKSYFRFLAFWTELYALVSFSLSVMLIPVNMCTLTTHRGKFHCKVQFSLLLVWEIPRKWVKRHWEANIYIPLLLVLKWITWRLWLQSRKPNCSQKKVRLC